MDGGIYSDVIDADENECRRLQDPMITALTNAELLFLLRTAAG